MNVYDHDDYSDIISLPHRSPAGRSRMPASARAAQFAPFAALSGYGAALAEETRHVQPPPDPEYRFCDDINYNLSLILSGYCRKASITYFVPDPVKPGGCYRSVYDEVCGADGDGRTIILKSGTRIALDSVTWIEPDIGSQDIEY